MGSPLPLRARNRLAALTLAAFHDPAARRELRSLGRGARSPSGWLEAGEDAHGEALRERAARATAALKHVPPGGAAPGLDEALARAAVLFDAGLFFETHEVLEPFWREATGGEREALQGLVQAAVGYQHRANGNERGATALLEEGGLRLHGRRLADLDLEPFARAVMAASRDPEHAAPPFPRPRVARAPEGRQSWISS